MEAGRNWDQARLMMTRVHKSEVENLNGWIAVPGKDLLTQYGEDKGKQLWAKREATGMYYDHEDFPGDQMERFYYMKKAKEVNKRTGVKDETKLQAQTALDGDMIKALVDENEGVMRMGGLPDVQAASAAGQKALLEGLGDTVQAAPKKRPANKNKEVTGSQEAKPKTMVEKAVDLMADVLSDATKARKKGMGLGAVNYAGELANQLLEFAKVMEGFYTTLQTATTNKVDNEPFYLKVFKKIEVQREWFTGAEAYQFQLVSKGFPMILQPNTLHFMNLRFTIHNLHPFFSSFLFKLLQPNNHLYT